MAAPAHETPKLRIKTRPKDGDKHSRQISVLISSSESFHENLRKTLKITVFLVVFYFSVSFILHFCYCILVTFQIVTAFFFFVNEPVLFDCSAKFSIETFRKITMYVFGLFVDSDKKHFFHFDRSSKTLPHDS